MQKTFQHAPLVASPKSVPQHLVGACWSIPYGITPAVNPSNDGLPGLEVGMGAPAFGRLERVLSRSATRRTSGDADGSTPSQAHRLVAVQPSSYWGEV